MKLDVFSQLVPGRYSALPTHVMAINLMQVFFAYRQLCNT